MICIPLSAGSNTDMLALIARAEKQAADMYEFRFDLMDEPPEVERLMAAATRPVMATCRSVQEGGRFRGGFADRRNILRRAGLAGAAYIDSEASDLTSLGECGNAIRIVSMHDFDGTPADLDYRISALSATSADWVKFAVTARRSADNLRVFSALAKCDKPAIAIAMGELGVVSRILGMRHGSRVTFGSLDSGLESAPGQPTADDLAGLYRVHHIDEKTELFGYLGDPGNPSPNHVIHNQSFINAGMNAVCIPFMTRDAQEFLAAMPDALGLRFLSVDRLHAAAALAWADEATPKARRMRAANILVRKKGRWLADNTETQASSESSVFRSLAL